MVGDSIKGLERLTASLANIDTHETIALTLHLDAGQSRVIHDFVGAYQWSAGPKQVRVRHSPAGASLLAFESWYPPSDHEWSILLDTDTEVSPNVFEWLNDGRRACEPDPGCIGVGLHSPTVSDSGDAAKVPLAVGKVHGPAYLVQLPAALGGALKPGPWREFRRWAEHHPAGQYGGELDLAQATGWPAVWRRHLLELMLIMDWFVLYPSFDKSQTGYSVHQANQLASPRFRTGIPSRIHGDLGALSWLNHRHEPILNVTEALMSSTRPLTTPTKNTSVACGAYNPVSHATLVQTGLTIVIGHLYTRTRFSGFLTNLIQYCNYSNVRRIVVVWYVHAVHSVRPG